MNLTVQELKEKLDRGDDFEFIDVREPYEYEEFNIGAKLIPLGQIGQHIEEFKANADKEYVCLLYTSPSPRDATLSRMPSSA